MESIESTPELINLLKGLLKRLENLFQQDSQFILNITRAIHPDLTSGTRLELLVQMFKMFENDSLTKVEDLTSHLKNPSDSLQLLLNIYQIEEHLLQINDNALLYISEVIPQTSTVEENFSLLRNVQNVISTSGRENLLAHKKKLIEISLPTSQDEQLLLLCPEISSPLSGQILKRLLLKLEESQFDYFKNRFESLSENCIWLLSQLLSVDLDLPLVKKKLRFNNPSNKRTRTPSESIGQLSDSGGFLNSSEGAKGLKLARTCSSSQTTNDSSAEEAINPIIVAAAQEDPTTFLSTFSDYIAKVSKFELPMWRGANEDEQENGQVQQSLQTSGGLGVSRSKTMSTTYELDELKNLMEYSLKESTDDQSLRNLSLSQEFSSTHREIGLSMDRDSRNGKKDLARAKDDSKLIDRDNSKIGKRISPLKIENGQAKKTTKIEEVGKKVKNEDKYENDGISTPPLTATLATPITASLIAIVTQELRNEFPQEQQSQQQQSQQVAKKTISNNNNNNNNNGSQSISMKTVKTDLRNSGGNSNNINNGIDTNGSLSAKKVPTSHPEPIKAIPTQTYYPVQQYPGAVNMKSLGNFLYDPSHPNSNSGKQPITTVTAITVGENQQNQMISHTQKIDQTHPRGYTTHNTQNPHSNFRSKVKNLHDDVGMGSLQSHMSAENMGFRLIIQKQPPSETVYQRILKPPPTLMVTCPSNSYNLFIEVALLRSDTLQEMPQCLEGTKSVPITTNSQYGQHHQYGVFNKLKISATSLQQGSLFSLKFTLKKFEDSVFVPVPEIFVISKPFEVFSHTCYLNPKANIQPSFDMKEIIATKKCLIHEIIPPYGSCVGNQRIVIIGNNFINSDFLVVRFGTYLLKPIFHEPGTLICVTPPAKMRGIISVIVHNRQGDESNMYYFEYT